MVQGPIGNLRGVRGTNVDATLATATPTPAGPTTTPTATRPIDRFVKTGAAEDVPDALVNAALNGQFENIPWIPKVNFAALARMRGDDLLAALRAEIGRPHVLDYEGARKHIYSEIDGENGVVVSVYDKAQVPAGAIPDADGPNGMNAEHTLPQSQLKRAGQDAGVSDMHHIFPTGTSVNSKRGSTPFGVVAQVEWQNDSGSKLGRDAAGHLVFEPPQKHKGNVARAMLYMVAFYQMKLSDWETNVLRQWNREDPVDQAEMERTLEIARIQGSANPFVLKPDLVDNAVS